MGLGGGAIVLTPMIQQLLNYNFKLPTKIDNINNYKIITDEYARKFVDLNSGISFYFNLIFFVCVVSNYFWFTFCLCSVDRCFWNLCIFFFFRFIFFFNTYSLQIVRQKVCMQNLWYDTNTSKQNTKVKKQKKNRENTHSQI